MARCGRGRMSAHPASSSFCSPEVKLTVPSRVACDIGSQDCGKATCCGHSSGIRALRRPAKKVSSASACVFAPNAAARLKPAIVA